MRTNESDVDGDLRERAPSTPPCAHCGSMETEPMATMQRHTVDADPWYRCEECGHVFSTPRNGEN
jgi:uncharacterized Zn finger protein